MPNIYEPAEDSFLLLKSIKKYARKDYNCLDLGTGSGILALEAAKYCKKVIAVDKNQDAIDYCKKNIKNKRIIFKESDLFSDIHEKFDLILFNPPYLPFDKYSKDDALDGGKHGYEIIQMFFQEVNNYFKIDGIILMVFSSLTNKEMVDKIINDNLFEFSIIGQEKMFFEILYVYKINKNKFLKIFDKKNIKNIKKLTRGHRGLIYTGMMPIKKGSIIKKSINNLIINEKIKNNKKIIIKNNKIDNNIINEKIAIKIQRRDKEAKNTINNEIKKLKILSKYNIGQKLIDHGNNFFIYDYIDGLFIGDFINKTKNKKLIITILKNIFNQLFILDKLKLNKEEMHHPYKHIIIDKRHNSVLIDFERCKITKKPKNITQFCQYLISSNFTQLLKKKNIIIKKNKMINLCKKYKKEMNKYNFDQILNELK